MARVLHRRPRVMRYRSIRRRGQLQDYAFTLSCFNRDGFALTVVCGNKVLVRDITRRIVKCEDLVLTRIQSAKAEIPTLVGLHLLVNIKTLASRGVRNADYLHVGNGL